MSRFLLQLLYLPVTIFMASVNALGKALGSTQAANPGGVPGSGLPSSVPASVGGFSATPSGGTASPGNTGFGNPNTKESFMGVDYNQDLSGDDIKTVLYSIIFTKRDLETTLQGQKEDIVNYSTNGASYGALLMGKFSATGKFDRPDSWKNYPPGISKDKDLTVADIPPEDRRYIQIEFKVTSRIPKSAADYDKRQAQALEDIARNTKPPLKVEGI